MDFTQLDVETGTQVAQAAHETLMAEEEVLQRTMELYEMEMQIIKQQLAEVRVRVADADAQATAMQSIRDGHLLASTTPQHGPQGGNNGTYHRFLAVLLRI